MGSSWPFAAPPHGVHSSKLGMETINRIIYGHSLKVGTGAGAYRGGLVQQLAFGGSDNKGREFNHYASNQNNVGSGLI